MFPFFLLLKLFCAIHHYRIIDTHSNVFNVTVISVLIKAWKQWKNEWMDDNPGNLVLVSFSNVASTKWWTMWSRRWTLNGGPSS